MSYCAEADVKLIFGTVNINNWLNLDNDGNPTTMAARMAQYILFIDDELDDMFRQLSYRVSLVNQAGTIPTTITRLAAVGVGLALWAAAGRPQNDYTMLTEWYERTKSQIASGQIRLNAV